MSCPLGASLLKALLLLPACLACEAVSVGRATVVLFPG
jgi:hypothetical protein